MTNNQLTEYFIRSTDENAPSLVFTATAPENAVGDYCEEYYFHHQAFITTTIRVETVAKPPRFYRVDAVQGEFIISDITGAK